MQTVGTILASIGGLGVLICFILVVIQMFQHGQTGLGIACIVLAFCCFGVLIAFVYGWIKHREWGITNIMYAWTACWALSIVGNAMTPPDFSQIQKQMNAPRP